MNEKYTHYANDKAINTMLKKLQYAIKTAIEKINEMKDDMMDDDMGRAQGLSRRRDIHDIPPQSRILQDIAPDFRKLTPLPPGTKASAAFPGKIAWDGMFKGDDFRLPDTSLMSQFRDAIPHEQFQQIAKEVVQKISNVKENFCKRMY